MIAHVEKKFRSRLEPRGPGGAWTFLRIPFDVNKAFGSKGACFRSQKDQRLRFQEFAIRGGDGTHILWVKKVLEERAGVSPGDSVQVSLARDLAKRVVAIPALLKRALAHSGKARAAF